jgi:hypothetical protein
MTEESPLHADFNYAEAYPVPEVTLEEFQAFIESLLFIFESDRADAFASVLLWVRCGVPSRLVQMGLGDESAMMLAHVMLDNQVKAFTGLTLSQISAAVPDEAGINAHALYLSNEVLNNIATGFEYISSLIEAFMYPSHDLCARVKVLEQVSQVTPCMFDAPDKLYATPEVHLRVVAKWGGL